jgi:hypothetical protein
MLNISRTAIIRVLLGIGEKTSDEHATVRTLRRHERSFPHNLLWGNDSPPVAVGEKPVTCPAGRLVPAACDIPQDRCSAVRTADCRAVSFFESDLNKRICRPSPVFQHTDITYILACQKTFCKLLNYAFNGMPARAKERQKKQRLQRCKKRCV